jgi:uncharacterized damage-inducible protein DinB
VTQGLRSGALGALLDEYERALGALSALLGTLSDSAFELTRDRETRDNDCRSVQTVLAHVTSSGYGYADMIRSAIGADSTRPDLGLRSRATTIDGLAALVPYMEETLRDRWTMSYEEMAALRIQARWGPTYDLEQLLEHAIVHVLRHRRQIEGFLREPRFRGADGA